MIGMLKVQLNPRLGRQVLFLAGFLLCGLVLLAWRSETDRHSIREGLWDACSRSAMQITEYNDGLANAYYAAVLAQQLSINGTPPSREQAEQQRVLADALGERLAFPVPVCGPDPRL